MAAAVRPPSTYQATVIACVSRRPACEAEPDAAQPERAAAARANERVVRRVGDEITRQRLALDDTIRAVRQAELLVRGAHRARAEHIHPRRVGRDAPRGLVDGGECRRASHASERRCDRAIHGNDRPWVQGGT
jgi:hypothetical protein